MTITRKLLLPALTMALMTIPFSLAQNGQPAAPATGELPANVKVAPAIKAGGVMALDIPDSSAQAVTLDILKGRFSDYSVGRIKLTGEGIDFRNGTLQGLRAEVLDGDFDNLVVDTLKIGTPAFSFDTMALLNQRTFILDQPVTANVNLILSEAGLNKFLANPKTLGKIEKAIQKKTGGLKLLTFSNPSIAMLGGDKVKLNVTGNIAEGLTVPMEMMGKLAIRNGQVSVTNLSVSSGGNDLGLPVDVAKAFEDKINEIIDFKRIGKSNFVITADRMKLNGKHLHIEGHATLTKLQFG
jgi:hypothetical protein